MMYSLLSLSLFLIGSLAQTSTSPPAGTSSTTASGAGVVAGVGTGVAAVPVVQAPQAATSTTTTQAPIVEPPAQYPPVQQPPTNSGNPGVVTPVPPTNPGTGTPGTGVTPQPPPSTPQYGYPNQYNPGFGGGFGPGMGGILDPQTLKCEFGQCRNRRITMTPGQGFKLECNMMRQCDNLDLTLNIGLDPTSFGNQVTDINDFIFDAPQTGVKITMNNMFPGQNIEVNNILCKRPGSCTNMRVTAGMGVELHEINMKCEMPGACTGCTINGLSCEMVSMMTGNHHGGMSMGFGYMNQPNMPGAGAQPGAGFGGAAPAPQTGFGGAPAAPQQPQYQQPQYPQPQYPQYPQYGYPQYGYPYYPQFNPYQQWI